MKADVTSQLSFFELGLLEKPNELLSLMLVVVSLSFE